MRICVSGTSCLGKTTFINDFIEEWPMYKTPENTYRHLLKDGNHSKRTSKEVQWAILNYMLDNMQDSNNGDHVIYDRGPLDNLMYTIWAHSKNIGGIDSEFVQKCVPLVRESMKMLDIIFFIPVTKVSPVEVEDDGIREIDPDFNTEIDHLFKAAKYDWAHNAQSKFFDPQDKPAIIEIFGKPHERIEMAKWYLNVDGDSIESVGGILSETEMQEIAALKEGFGIEDTDTEAIRSVRNPTEYQ